jgi:molybdate transport repressor ModE-like protein
VEWNGWLGLELRYLAALEAIAEEGSFARAAERLGYTQSAISHQIAALERIVGRQLFDRPGGRRPVVLTDAGQVVLEQADAIRRQVQTASARLARIDAGAAGRLQIGTYESLAARILPSVLTEFRAVCPGVEVRVLEAAAEHEPAALLADGRVQVALMSLPLPEGPFEHVECLRDPFVLVVQAGSPLTRLSRPSLMDLADERLIGFRACPFQRRLEADFRAVGLDTSGIFHSDTNATVQAMAAEGLGAAVMPRLTVDLPDRRIRTIPLDHLIAPRTIGLVWRADEPLSAPARIFVKLARQASARWVASRAPRSEPIDAPATR